MRQVDASQHKLQSQVENIGRLASEEAVLLETNKSLMQEIATLAERQRLLWHKRDEGTKLEKTLYSLEQSLAMAKVETAILKSDLLVY